MTNPSRSKQRMPVYNSVHHYGGPLMLGIIAFWLQHQLLLQLALIWLSHISVDRVFGYGLKYDDAFKHTHLQEL